MLEFARWKYIVVAAVTLLALVIAAPNFFGEDIALQVVRKDRAVIDDAGRKSVEDALDRPDGVGLSRQERVRGDARHPGLAVAFGVAEEALRFGVAFTRFAPAAMQQ